METLAQCLSIAGLVCVVASYQQKKKTALILCQSVGGLIFGIHYLILGAYAGCLLNLISLIKGFVFYKEKRSEKEGRIRVSIVVALCIIAYAMTFLVFGTDPTPVNLFLEVLPTIGMIALTVAFNMTSAGNIRALGPISSVCWLTYNIAHLSIGGIACEVICLASIVIGILRHDVKKKV